MWVLEEQHYLQESPCIVVVKEKKVASAENAAEQASFTGAMQPYNNLDIVGRCCWVLHRLSWRWA